MTEMKSELIVSGGTDFDPDRFEGVVGLAADQTYRIGDRIGRSTMHRDCNAWVISTGYSQVAILSDCVSPLLKRLEPYREKLKAALPAATEIQLSVAAYVDESVPELNLTRDVIALLSSFGASLDIDVILARRGAVDRMPQ